MTTPRQKIVSEIKDILKAQYDIKTLKEAIAASSASAVQDLIKKNPNIDLKTLRSSLGKAGHGGVKQIAQADLDAVKKKLGIPVQAAAPAKQQGAPQQPQQPQTPAPVSNSKDDNIEQADVDKVKKLTTLASILPQEYVSQLNKNITSLGIQGVQDIASAEKFIDDYDSIFLNFEDYKGLIHILGTLNDKTKFPSPVKAAPAQNKQ
jgi:hypothetical protein